MLILGLGKEGLDNESFDKESLGDESEDGTFQHIPGFLAPCHLPSQRCSRSPASQLIITSTLCWLQIISSKSSYKIIILSNYQLMKLSGLGWLQTLPALESPPQ